MHLNVSKIVTGGLYTQTAVEAPYKNLVDRNETVGNGAYHVNIQAQGADGYLKRHATTDIFANERENVSHLKARSVIPDDVLAQLQSVEGLTSLFENVKSQGVFDQTDAAILDDFVANIPALVETFSNLTPEQFGPLADWFVDHGNELSKRDWVRDHQSTITFLGAVGGIAGMLNTPIAGSLCVASATGGFAMTAPCIYWTVTMVGTVIGLTLAYHYNSAGPEDDLFLDELHRAKLASNRVAMTNEQILKQLKKLSGDGDDDDEEEKDDGDGDDSYDSYDYDDYSYDDEDGEDYEDYEDYEDHYKLFKRDQEAQSIDIVDGSLRFVSIDPRCLISAHCGENPKNLVSVAYFQRMNGDNVVAFNIIPGQTHLDLAKKLLNATPNKNPIRDHAKGLLAGKVREKIAKSREELGFVSFSFKDDVLENLQSLRNLDFSLANPREEPIRFIKQVRPHVRRMKFDSCGYRGEPKYDEENYFIKLMSFLKGSIAFNTYNDVDAHCSTTRHIVKEKLKHGIKSGIKGGLNAGLRGAKGVLRSGKGLISGGREESTYAIEDVDNDYDYGAEETYDEQEAEVYDEEEVEGDDDDE